jgi:hypothetical protein
MSVAVCFSAGECHHYPRNCTLSRPHKEPVWLQIADIWSCGVMVYVMLVGAYPFERPEDKHDNQKLQKMIQVTFPWGLVMLLPSFAVLSLVSA